MGASPLVVPKLHERPWCVPLVSHDRDNKNWEESVPYKTKDSPHQTSFQGWVLYSIRFPLAGDILDVWSEFGGLSGQLNHLSIATRLAVAGNLAISLIYDQGMKQPAQRLAKRREEGSESPQLFSQENDEIKRNIKTERGKTKSKKTALSDKAWKGKKGAKGDKGKGQHRTDGRQQHPHPQQHPPQQQ